MRKIVYILLITLTAMSAGCSADEKIAEPDETPIYAGNDVTPSSTGGVVESNGGIAQVDVNGIQVHRLDGTTYDFSTVSSVSITASIKRGQRDMVFAPRQYFDAAHTPANFVAYYPSGGTFNSPGVVWYDLTGQEDILTSAPRTATLPQNSEGNPIRFAFRHELSRIDLVVVAADQGTIDTYGAITEASVIGMPDEVQIAFDQAGNATFSRRPGSTSVADFDFEGVEWNTSGQSTLKYGNAMVIPVESTVNVRIRLGFANRPTQEYTVPLTLSRATRNIITAKVTAHPIIFSVTVKEWNNAFGPDGKTINIGGSN